jgi:hypothetical protein
MSIESLIEAARMQLCNGNNAITAETLVEIFEKAQEIEDDNIIQNANSGPR